MTLRLGAFAAALAAIAFVLLGCGGGGSGGATSTVAPLPTDAQGTPQTFEYFRDHLADRLDAIGPEPGSVPPDIRQELLVQCGQLVNYADRNTVAQLCNAINRSFTSNDPGLMDLVVAELAKLKAK